MKRDERGQLLDNLKELNATDKNGIHRTFYYGYYEANERTSIAVRRTWFFSVHLCNPPDQARDDFFDLKVMEFNESSVRVDFISNNGREAYRGKGIPEALFKEVTQVLGKEIVSTKVHGNDPEGAYFTIDAEKMWGRLELKHLAKYDASSDRYIFSRD